MPYRCLLFSYTIITSLLPRPAPRTQAVQLAWMASRLRHYRLFSMTVQGFRPTPMIMKQLWRAIKGLFNHNHFCYSLICYYEAASLDYQLNCLKKGQRTGWELGRVNYFTLFNFNLTTALHPGG